MMIIFDFTHDFTDEGQIFSTFKFKKSGIVNNTDDSNLRP